VDSKVPVQMVDCNHAIDDCLAAPDERLIPHALRPQPVILDALRADAGGSSGLRRTLPIEALHATNRM
jgi:hypothetical protein